MENQPPNRDIYRQACAIIAEHQLAARPGPPVIAPHAWLAKAEQTIAAQHAIEIQHIDLARHTPETLAARLEHGPGITPARQPPQRHLCPTCDNNGWVDDHTDETGNWFVKRCPACP